MKENDGRKLDHKTLEEIRIRAVKQVEAGESPEEVIKALGMSRPRIYEWLAAYREGGYEALKAKKLSAESAASLGCWILCREQTIRARAAEVGAIRMTQPEANSAGKLERLLRPRRRSKASRAGRRRR